LTITTVQEAVKRMEAGFWRRYEANPDLRRKLDGKTRVIQLAVPDGDSYWFLIENGRLSKIEQGSLEAADATVTANKADLLAVFNGEMKAMQAYLTGRVKVKASFADLLFARSLLG
jgi:putative sterol carrier protein